MNVEKCPKCKSEDIRIIDDLEFDPGNVFGFTKDNYDAIKNGWCNSCQFEWRLEKEKREFSIEELRGMKLSQVADVIFGDWRNMSQAALPYVEAMLNLEKISDSFGADDGETVVVGFLINAQSWRGETARNVKRYLRNIQGQ